MSRTINNQSWGPNHQSLEAAPSQRSRVWKVLGWFLLAMFVHGIIDPRGGNILGWSAKMVFFGWVATKLYQGVRDGRIPVDWLIRLGDRALDRLGDRFERIGADQLYPELESAGPTGEGVRARVAQLGGGAYLGLDEEGRWVTADPQSAIMVLGPPRSGKTSCAMIPAVLGAPGAVISSSTKPDVMSATRRARGEVGQVWLFDPAGEDDAPEGVRRLRWSPVAAARSWDQALIMAKAMTACTRVGAGTTNENHWTERAGTLLAPLLYAAYLTDTPIDGVLLWTLRQELAPAMEVLADSGAHIPASVLVGIQQTDGRERSSIFSAAAGVLAAYNADATRAGASDPNFDPDKFAGSSDTIYITAPEQYHSLCAPLIVGLLEQIRHCVYRRSYTHGSGATMLWALDEVANIAPIHDLPALVSQAGGQNLQVMVGLQDLSQARTRWGDAAADGFMSLFQTRLVLDGIADSRTLESISLALGEYDRELVSTSSGTNENGEWFTPQGHSENVSYHTQRQRTLIPGEIAQLPDGNALLLRGASWGLIELTPWFEHEPWASIGGHAC